MDDNASIPPAPLEQVIVLVAFPRVDGFVKKRPGQLMFSVDLKLPSCPHTDVFPAKVAVLLITVVRPEEKGKCEMLML